MKALPRLLALAVSFLGALPALRAADATPPIVANAPAPLTVEAGTKTSVVDLSDTFALTGVAGQVVRFQTPLGNLDVELRDDVAPNTVANFLSNLTAGAYKATLIHRSEPNLLLQGGTYRLIGGQINQTLATSSATDSFHLSNVRGTLAAVPESGSTVLTSGWFFNLADSNASTLDAQKYIVFGALITDGLERLDQIAALPTTDLSSQLGPSFAKVPLLHYKPPAPPKNSNLLLVQTIKPIPLLPAKNGETALLKLKIVGNTQPKLVTATLKGPQLKLAFHPGKTGTATITIRAKDSATTAVEASLNVAVQ